MLNELQIIRVQTVIKLRCKIIAIDQLICSAYALGIPETILWYYNDQLLTDFSSLPSGKLSIPAECGNGESTDDMQAGADVLRAGTSKSSQG